MVRKAAPATLALLLALAAVPAWAQEPPDLSGFWYNGFADDPAERDVDLLARLPQDAVLIEDTGVAEFPRGEFGGLTLTPEALEKAQQWNAEDEMTLQRVCLPPSIVYAIQGPFPFEIVQTQDVIVFRYEYFDQVRLIYMDGRAHPPQEAPHSKTGFSTGHWEGSDLVIETSHLAASTITNNGLDHTDGVRMVERYRLTADGQGLHATQWFSDPAVLETDGARYITWDKREGEYINPYECDPSFALEYQQVGAD
jgi:hypothetical protein